MSEQKAIWGSTRYFIKIEPDTNLFSTSMTGVVSFYDTHGIINDKECSNLQLLVKAVYDFWATILAPHETRVARWLEEYFDEINIKSDYKLILKLIRSEELLEQHLEDLIEETAKIPTEDFEKGFETVEDNKVIGSEITFTKLPEDEYSRKELLQRLLEDNKYVTPDKVSSRSQFKLANGEMKTKKTENKLGIGDSLSEASLKSGLKNEYEDAITDVEIIDELPYTFEISDIQIEGSDTKPLKEKREKVLEVIWEIPEIPAKQEVEINYTLKKRINRTILEIMDDKVIGVLNTFEGISSTGLEFISNTKYLNIHNRPLQELHIIDEIPPEFNIIKIDPEAFPPTGVVEKAKLKGINIRWNQKNISIGQTIEKKYKLDYFPYLFRGKKIIKNKDGKTIFKAAKFVQSNEREAGYSVLYILKNVGTDKEDLISISDKLPLDHEISETQPSDSQIMEQIEKLEKTITWITEAPALEEEKTVMIKVSGNTPPLFELFKVFVGDKEEKEILEKEASIGREMIKTPEYFNQVFD